MRASSESIGQFAAAMARAQLELVNPAKSLTAVLERGRNGGGAFRLQTMRLSAGLDIVRKPSVSMSSSRSCRRRMSIANAVWFS